MLHSHLKFSDKPQTAQARFVCIANQQGIITSRFNRVKYQTQNYFLCTIVAAASHIEMQGARFFDTYVGLIRESFVGGADTMIDVATAHIPAASQGSLPFSQQTTSPTQRMFWNGSGKKAAATCTLGRKRHGRLALSGVAQVFRATTGKALHPGKGGGIVARTPSRSSIRAVLETRQAVPRR